MDVLFARAMEIAGGSRGGGRRGRSAVTDIVNKNLPDFLAALVFPAK